MLRIVSNMYRVFHELLYQLRISILETISKLVRFQGSKPQITRHTSDTDK